VVAGVATALLGFTQGVRLERRRLRGRNYRTKWYTDRSTGHDGSEVQVIATRPRGTCYCGGTERIVIGRVRADADDFDEQLARLEALAAERAMTMNGYENDPPFKRAGHYDYP